jgi:hypothetical protein
LVLALYDMRPYRLFSSPPCSSTASQLPGRDGAAGRGEDLGREVENSSVIAVQGADNGLWFYWQGIGDTHWHRELLASAAATAAFAQPIPVGDEGTTPAAPIPPSTVRVITTSGMAGW